MDGEYWVLVLGVSFSLLSSIVFVIRVCIDSIDVINVVRFFFFSLSFLSLSIRKFRAREEKRAKGQERSSLSERLFFVLYIMVFYSILFVDFFTFAPRFFL